MRFLRKSVVVLLAAFPVVAPALSHAPIAPNQPANGNQAASSGSETEQAISPSYLTYSVKELKKKVPALHGLKDDSDSSQLPFILSQIGQTIAGVVPRLPDVISREDVYRSQGDIGPTVPHQLRSLTRAGTGPMSPSYISGEQQGGEEFRYLILCRRTPEGSTMIEESRTDLKGHPVKSLKDGTTPLGFGFAYQWLLFSSANQSEFRFRYLGEQKVDGRKTFVVAFAQTPGQVQIPAIFQSSGKKVPYYYQGILWVDQSTFNIVLLRSDLLAPLPSLQLERLTTELRFHSVRIQGLDARFWLPSELNIVVDQGMSEINEGHRYSDYHLYHTTSRIVPSP
jgi:hypothetical protein